MKIRIASSIALAAALTLGATGCSLIAAQDTLIQYAPSDGVDANVNGVEVRNLMLVADESGEQQNVVFTGINAGEKAQQLTISFMADGQQVATSEFEVPAGTTKFGDPEGEQSLVLVKIPEAKAGTLVDAYLSTPGSAEVQHRVPVLDGSLKEYRPYVLTAEQIAKFSTPAEKAADAKSGAESTPAN